MRRSTVKVTWTKASPGQTYNDDGILADYRTIAADWAKPGIDMVKKGDADAALKGLQPKREGKVVAISGTIKAPDGGSALFFAVFWLGTSQQAPPAKPAPPPGR